MFGLVVELFSFLFFLCCLWDRKKKSERKKEGVHTDEKVLVDNKTGGVPTVRADDKFVDDAALVSCDGVIARDADKGDKRRLLKLKPVLLEGPVSDAVLVVPLIETEAALVDFVGLSGGKHRKEYGKQCCVTGR